MPDTVTEPPPLAAIVACPDRWYDDATCRASVNNETWPGIFRALADLDAIPAAVVGPLTDRFRTERSWVSADRALNPTRRQVRHAKDMAAEVAVMLVHVIDIATVDAELVARFTRCGSRAAYLVAAHPDASPELLDSLASHPSILVRLAVARNPSTPSPTLRTIALRAPSDVQAAALRNPRCAALFGADPVRWAGFVHQNFSGTVAELVALVESDQEIPAP